MDIGKGKKSQEVNVIELSGRGIHSGAPVSIKIHPRETGGIVFRRVDLPGAPDIAARYDNVGDTKMRNTTIGDVRGAHVQTVEHLMAALFLAGVRDALVEIDGPETPILDGSADMFMAALKKAGWRRAQWPRIIVKKEVTVSVRDVRRTLPMSLRVKLWIMDKIARRRNDGFVRIAPNKGTALEIDATLVYSEKVIGRQSYSYIFDGSAASQDVFLHDIARARTFGKFSEWEYLKAHGMARGADATNVIALNDAGDGTLNQLHWADEFVRHKIIDAIGDMATSGGMICGKLTSYKGSHAMNNLVLKKLFSNPDNYDIIQAKE